MKTRVSLKCFMSNYKLPWPSLVTKLELQGILATPKLNVNNNIGNYIASCAFQANAIKQLTFSFIFLVSKFTKRLG